MMEKYLGKENYELFGYKERFQFDDFDLYVSNDNGLTYFWVDQPCELKYSRETEAAFIVMNFNKVKEALKHVRNIALIRRDKRESYKESIKLIVKMVNDND